MPSEPYKPINELKTKQIAIHLSEDEFEMIDKYILNDRTCYSESCREILLGYCILRRDLENAQTHGQQPA